ncbi:hypothetical protein V8C86DRAFT_2611985 [Haematococcus lacustris]
MRGRQAKLQGKGPARALEGARGGGRGWPGGAGALEACQWPHTMPPGQGAWARARSRAPGSRVAQGGGRGPVVPCRNLGLAACLTSCALVAASSPPAGLPTPMKPPQVPLAPLLTCGATGSSSSSRALARGCSSRLPLFSNSKGPFWQPLPGNGRMSRARNNPARGPRRSCCRSGGLRRMRSTVSRWQRCWRPHQRKSFHSLNRSQGAKHLCLASDFVII